MSSISPHSSASNGVACEGPVPPSQLGIDLSKLTKEQLFGLACKYYESCGATREVFTSSGLSSSEVGSAVSLQSEGGTVWTESVRGQCYLRAVRKPVRAYVRARLGANPTFSQLLGERSDLFLPSSVLERIRLTAGFSGVHHLGDDGEYALLDVLVEFSKSPDCQVLPGTLAARVVKLATRPVDYVSDVQVHHRLGLRDFSARENLTLSSGAVLKFGRVPDGFTVQQLLSMPVERFKPRKSLYDVGVTLTNGVIEFVRSSGQVSWLRCLRWLVHRRGARFPEGSLGAVARASMAMDQTDSIRFRSWSADGLRIGSCEDFVGSGELGAGVAADDVGDDGVGVAERRREFQVRAEIGSGEFTHSGYCYLQFVLSEHRSWVSAALGPLPTMRSLGSLPERVMVAREQMQDLRLSCVSRGVFHLQYHGRGRSFVQYLVGVARGAGESVGDATVFSTALGWFDVIVEPGLDYDEEIVVGWHGSHDGPGEMVSGYLPRQPPERGVGRPTDVCVAALIREDARFVMHDNCTEVDWNYLLEMPLDSVMVSRVRDSYVRSCGGDKWVISSSGPVSLLHLLAVVVQGRFYAPDTLGDMISMCVIPGGAVTAVNLADQVFNCGAFGPEYDCSLCGGGGGFII